MTANDEQVRGKRARSVAALALTAVVAIIIGTFASGWTIYSASEVLQPTLHYTRPDTWGTIEFNVSSARLVDFNFNLGSLNLGNATERIRMYPLQIQIWHAPGTWLDSLQLQFNSANGLPIDVLSGTQEGAPWNAIKITGNQGTTMVSIADFGPIGVATVNIGLVVSPPVVGANYSLTANIQLGLHHTNSWMVGHIYTGAYTIGITVTPTTVVFNPSVLHPP